ncbi:hypothetical protein Rhein_0001 [Rheinheimera sp. A13L]|uniref:hypothetical protein n=1 Tax=Rheinheimera sp. A13L TaxID=506534 RepID=UPI0002124F4E|nr:hypothetical protein [Rheinheimera sp. A13L]EGM79543.1 hypothetical protein Rhein_0001 [Rheinheimera sp. A13L]
MNKGMLIFACCLLLAGCGGSGGGSSDSGSGSTNTAPVISGALSFDVTVLESRVLTYAVTDAEQDAVTVSFANKPEWIEGALQNNQLTLSMKPGFFDIKNHTFSITLSDGKAKSTYDFSVNVTDDSQRWVQINKAESEFVGQWSFDNNSKLVLYPNNEGVYVQQDDNISKLSWQYRNGYVELHTEKLICLEECHESIELYMVAEKDHLRRLILESDIAALAVTATKAQQQNMAEGIYVTPQFSNGKAQQVLANSIEFELPIHFEFGYGSSTSFMAAIELATVKNDKNKTVQLPAEPIYSFPIWLHNFNANESTSVDVDIQLVDAEFLPSESDILVFSYGVKVTLKDATINPENYIGLSELLDTELRFFATLLKAQSLPVPEFDLNVSYFSGFRLKHDFTESDFVFGGSEVIFTSNTEGKAIFTLAATQQKSEQAFTWRVANEQLIITLDGKNYTYGFIKTPMGDISIVAGQDWYSPFVQQSIESKTDDLIGSFFYGNSITGSDKYYMNIFPNYTASLFSFYPETESTSHYNKWRAETDGAMTILYSFACAREDSFSRCETDLEQRYENNEPVTLEHQSLKVVAKDDKHTWIHRSITYKNRSINRSYEHFEKVFNVPMN